MKQVFIPFQLQDKYKPESQYKADALTRRSQDLPADSDFRQDYMKQVVLIPKNLSIIQSVQILRWGDTRPIDAVKQNLKSTINNVYQKMDSKDPVAVISQMITDRVYHSCYYSLSDYSLENRQLYHYGKLHQPNIESVCIQVL